MIFESQKFYYYLFLSTKKKNQAPKNAFRGVLFFLAANKANYMKNLDIYLRNELLGGLHGVCKTHSELFFNDIAQGKMWTIESKFNASVNFVVSENDF